MAGETLFRRKVQVLIAVPVAENFSSVSAQVTNIENLRVSFRVNKSLVKDPNSAEIKIYNLSSTTRAALPGTGAKVILRAGYATTMQQIFIGDARAITSKKEQTEFVTAIECGDGQRAVQHARVSASFGPNAAISDVINTIGRVTKMDLGNLAAAANTLPPSQQYVHGYAAHGNALKELDKVLKVAGLEWSIQDGALQLLTPGEATTEEVIELSSESGLIGSPEMATGEKKEGKGTPAARPILHAKSLLQGGFRPGRRVQVKSRTHQGLFRCVKVDHVGDTAGGDWFSDLELDLK